MKKNKKLWLIAVAIVAIVAAVIIIGSRINRAKEKAAAGGGSVPGTPAKQKPSNTPVGTVREIRNENVAYLQPANTSRSGRDLNAI